MKNPLICAEYFHGTWAVIHSKRRLTVNVALVLGLLPALFIGFFVNLAGGATPRTVIEITGAFLALMAAGCPLLAASDTTLFASSNGTKTRREEFMAMPLGRLALPTAITALGAASFVLFAVCLLGSITLTLGLNTLPDAFASKPNMYWLLPTLCVGTFSYVNALGCLGNSPSLGLLLVPFV